MRKFKINFFPSEAQGVEEDFVIYCQGFLDVKDVKD